MLPLAGSPVFLQKSTKNTPKTIHKPKNHSFGGVPVVVVVVTRHRNGQSLRETIIVRMGRTQIL